MYSASVQVKLEGIPAGEPGTDATLRTIGRLVKAALRDPRIRHLALDILRQRNADSIQPLSSIRAIYNWIKANIRYVLDPINVETVQAPEVTLELGAGDCDDHAALLAALCMSVGIPVRFVVLGSSPSTFEHIYPEAQANGKWVPADTASALPFGIVPRMPVKKVYAYTGEPSMLHRYQGLSTYSVAWQSGDLQNVAYLATMDKLLSNWKTGRINRADLQSYLRVIDEGNSPFRGTIFDTAIRKGVSDFLDYVKRNALISTKPPTTMDGMYGLNGFFGSIVDAVKSGVNWVVDQGKKFVQGVKVTPPSVSVQPGQITVPQVTVQAQPGQFAEAAKSGVQTFTSSPWAWAALALAGGIVLTKVLGSKRAA